MVSNSWSRILEGDGHGYMQVTYREDTASQVPVPSVRDALGQHYTALVLRRAGRDPKPPYHPKELP